MPKHAWIAALTFLLSSASWTCASAACPNTKALYVFAEPTHDAFAFYYLLGKRTFRLVVKGKSIEADDKTVPGHDLFRIDDKTLQIVLVDRKSFAAFVTGKGEQATLEAQARYEQDYIRKSAPEAQITDLGLRTRTDDSGRGAKLFKLWSYEVAGRVPTYALSTLVDTDLVVMVAAIIPGTLDAVHEELASYASSLLPVPAAFCDKHRWD